MTRGRLVVLSSLAVVGAGAVLGVGAFLLDPARAAVGPLPAAGLALPASTRFVAGIDVRRLVASPLFERMRGPEGVREPLFREINDKTGLDVAKDIDQVVVAGGDPAAREAGVTLVFGRFDRYKLARAIEAEKGVTWNKVDGETVYLFGETSGRGAGAMAFVGGDVLALGSRTAVESVLANATRRAAALRANKSLTALLSQVKPGATFWAVGDQSLLSRLPSTIPAPGAGASIALPQLKSLIVTGELEPVVALELTGEAADEAAARNLADVVRGFVALAQLQAASKPELKELASAVSVTTDATRVIVAARLPYALLDTLRPKPPAAVAAPEPK